MISSILLSDSYNDPVKTRFETALASATLPFLLSLLVMVIAWGLGNQQSDDEINDELSFFSAKGFLFLYPPC
jgi:hypothetical protein